jgi:ubiquinone/menaquinone biosynthesis C-methylase UbiE
MATAKKGGFPAKLAIATDPRLGPPQATREGAGMTLETEEQVTNFINTLEQTRAAWDNIAQGYDKTRDAYRRTWVGDNSLHRIGLRSGMRFLDVAAGSGALSVPAARLGAQVLATDLSSVILDLLQKRARNEGLTIETSVMDGHALELDDNSFDMVGSQFGVMLFPDMPKGISEMVRVVKPGGRVLMIVLGNPRTVEFFAFFVRGIQSVRPDFTPPLDPPPLPFQLEDPERLRNELVKAGLKNVTIEISSETLEFETGKDLWTWVIWSNPVAETVLGQLDLSSDEREAIQQSLERMIRERAGGSGRATLVVPINVGIGTK